MLRINVSSIDNHHLTYEDFENNQIPAPVNGVVQINNDAILLFDSAREAVTYAEHLEEMSAYTSNHTRSKGMLHDVVNAIRSNELVKTYME